MNQQLISEAKAVFEQLIDFPAAERLTALESACRGSHELRAEVEALLENHEKSSGFLSLSLPELLVAPPQTSGRKIGAYEIIRTIGQGGSTARVYLARR